MFSKPSERTLQNFFQIQIINLQTLTISTLHVNKFPFKKHPQEHFRSPNLPIFFTSLLIQNWMILQFSQFYIESS